MNTLVSPEEATTTETTEKIGPLVTVKRIHRVRHPDVYSQHSVVCVFTSNTVQDFQHRGGVGWWIITEGRHEHLKWVIAIRRQQEGLPDDVPHGVGFFLGRIMGWTPRVDQDGKTRHLMSIQSWTPVYLPGIWDGRQVSVMYLTQRELTDRIGDPERYVWLPMLS